MNQTTKYGLFFLGGLVVGALGAVVVTRGKLDLKPLATDLLASGIDLKDKALGVVESCKTWLTLLLKPRSRARKRRLRPKLRLKKKSSPLRLLRKPNLPNFEEAFS